AIALDLPAGRVLVLREREARREDARRERRGRDALGPHAAIVASSLRLSPWLSVQVMTTLSPALAPAKRNDRNGFLATAGPHSADSTVLPFTVAVTFWMNQAGTIAPLESLRWPVSISWAMRTFTSTLSPTTVARIFIGSAMFLASAAAEGDLHLFRRVVVLAVRLHQRDHVGRLAHLDARVDPGLGAVGDGEVRGQHVGILLDQERDRLGLLQLARHRERHDGAVLRDVGRRHGDVLALGGSRAAERLHFLVEAALHLESGLVPCFGSRRGRAQQPRRHREPHHRDAACALESAPATHLHLCRPPQDRTRCARENYTPPSRVTCPPCRERGSGSARAGRRGSPSPIPVSRTPGEPRSRSPSCTRYWRCRACPGRRQARGRASCRRGSGASPAPRRCCGPRARSPPARCRPG